jgi:hypothetical protein
MKKVIPFMTLVSFILCFSSCSMKECRCLSSNTITQNDSLIQQESYEVSNSTRNSCDEFNADSTYIMDEALHIVVHHTVECQEN